MLKNKCITELLTLIYSDNAAGLNFHAKRTDFDQIVTVNQKMTISSLVYLSTDNKNYSYAKNAWAMILNYVSNGDEESEGIKINWRFSNNKKVYINDCLNYIVKHWKELKHWSYTYRFLWAAATASEGLNDTSNDEGKTIIIHEIQRMYGKKFD